jgi:hypothetical protein
MVGILGSKTLELPRETTKDGYLEVLHTFYDTVHTNWPRRAIPGMKYE